MLTIDDFNKILNAYKKETERSCMIATIKEEEPAITDDKISGIPYIPVGMEIPKDDSGEDMELVLQVNLKHVKLDNWPNNGILEVFITREFQYPSVFKTVLFEEGKPYRTDINPTHSFFISENGLKIELKKGKSYMPMSDYHFGDTICRIINEMYQANIDSSIDLDAYFADIDLGSHTTKNKTYKNSWDDFYNFDKPHITIGGYGNYVQTDPREFSENGENLTECLFKIDSCYNINLLQIGDAGIISANISKKDLKNKNFQNALIDWDCC